MRTFHGLKALAYGHRVFLNGASDVIKCSKSLRREGAEKAPVSHTHPTDCPPCFRYASLGEDILVAVAADVVNLDGWGQDKNRALSAIKVQEVGTYTGQDFLHLT